MDSLATIILASSLIIIMLGMGLSLQIADFKRILSYPKAMIVGLVNQIILLPIIGFVLVSVFSIQPEIAIGVMILAACPGGPTSNLITHLAKGDTALSVSLTAVNSLITIFTIPFIVNFALVQFMAEGQMIQLDISKTILQIFVIVIIPVAIGMLVRHYKSAFAERMAKPVRIASGVVLALVIVGIILKEKENVIPYFQQAGWITLALNVISMSIGYYSAKLFNISQKQAISISIESGIQNGTMAISIAAILLSRPDFAIAPAIYSLIMFFTGGLIVYFNLRKKVV
jgi:BASS family bile acid:Na+ symporter